MFQALGFHLRHLSRMPRVWILPAILPSVHHLSISPLTRAFVHYLFLSIVRLAQHDTLCVVAVFISRGWNT
jgi:hypothetical protein